jgi:transaldolase
MIKMPATDAGLGAITAATAAGMSVDVTLVFGLKRYVAVIDAYLRGFEQAATTGVDLTIRSVAPLFVSRVDTEIGDRLNRTVTVEAQALRTKSGIANARLPYEHDEAVIGSPRWQQLEARGLPANGRYGHLRESRTRRIPTRCT